MKIGAGYGIKKNIMRGARGGFSIGGIRDTMNFKVGIRDENTMREAGFAFWFSRDAGYYEVFGWDTG